MLEKPNDIWMIEYRRGPFSRPKCLRVINETKDVKAPSQQLLTKTEKKYHILFLTAKLIVNI
jgi:hypothetical protein